MSDTISTILTIIGYGLSEFTVFLLVDSIIKGWIQSISDQTQRSQIWLCESLALFILCVIIYGFHHVPCLLLILTAVTFFSSILQHAGLLKSIQTFVNDQYQQYRLERDDYSHLNEEIESEESSLRYNNSSTQALPRASIHRGQHSSPIDCYISPIQNRIESPTPFKQISTARTSTPHSHPNLSVTSKLKTLVGINPYVSLPPGLPNRGNNMCFINSVIQCLAHTPSLVKMLCIEAEPFLSVTTPEANFLRDFSYILKQCAVEPGSSDRKVCDNVQFCRTVSCLVPLLVSNPTCGPQQQQDAAELLLWLLNKTSEILIWNRDNHIDRWTGSVRTRTTHRTKSRNQWKNKVISQLMEVHDNKEMIHLLKIQTEEGLRLQHSETMHSQSCMDSVAVVSDISWLQYCQNHSTVITDIFAGQLAEIRQSSITNEVSFGTQAFHILPVPLVEPRKVSGLVQLQDCINAMGSLEELNDDDSLKHILKDPVNTLNRSATNATDHSGFSNYSASVIDGSSFTEGQYQTILRFPPDCLILQLNRFFYDQDEKLVRKIRSPVNIPRKNLDLSSLGYDKKNHNGHHNRAYMYDLYGICIHQGAETTQYGHYLSLCQLGNGQWYQFDDENVTHINVTYECNSLSVREGAYLLFYKRQINVN